VCGDRGSSKSDKFVTTSVFPEANYKVSLGSEEKSSGNLGRFHAVTGAVVKVNRHYERENLVRLKRNSIEIFKY
jgi:hypothetical protein